MPNHKNHGNRPHMKGFRPTHAPTMVEKETPITSNLGVNVDRQIVVIEYDRPVRNMHMTIEQVDEYIRNLQTSKEVLHVSLEMRQTALAKVSSRLNAPSALPWENA